MKLTAVEVWTEYEGNAGQRRAQVPLWSIESAERIYDLQGRDTLIVTLTRDTDAWSWVQERRVLRTEYDDNSVWEHRIQAPSQLRDVRGAETAEIEAQGPLFDLSQHTITRTNGDGTIDLVYSLQSLSHDELIDHILSSAPSWWTKGTVDDPDAEIELLQFDGDTVLGALQKLVEATDFELGIRRNGTSGYFLDFVERRNSSAEKPYLIYRKNIQGIRREPDAGEFANRIYVLGAETLGLRPHSGKSEWEAAIVSGDVVTLGGEPVFADDALNDKYAENIRTGNTWQITDSDRTNQTITLATGHDVVVGDFVAFRLNAAGDELVYVEDPSSVTNFGAAEAVLRAGDVPFVSNLVRNPALRRWDAGDPRNWEEVGTSGSLAVTRNTDSLFTRVGGSSAKVEGLAITPPKTGVGLRSALVPITVTDQSPFFAGYASVWNESTVPIQAYLEYRIPSTTVSVVDGFSSIQNAAAPENGDVVLSTDGAEAFSNLEDANASLATYKVYFDVDTTGVTLGGDPLIVKFYHNQSAGGTNWVFLGQKEYPTADTTFDLTDEVFSFSAKLGADYDIRVLIDATGVGGSWSVTLHGEDHATPGVQYDRQDSAEFVKGDIGILRGHKVWDEINIGDQRLPLEADAVRIVIVAPIRVGDVFYIDAAQITQRAQPLPFYEGRGPNELWRRGTRELRQRSSALIRYDVNVIDLTTIDRSIYPYDEFVIGGDVVVDDEDLGVRDTVRVVELRSDILAGQNTRIELEELVSVAEIGLLGEAPLGVEVET